MDKEKRLEVLEKVEDCIKNRKDNGVLESETDFLAGAMCVLDALGETIPPHWVMYIMSGRSVMDK